MNVEPASVLRPSFLSSAALLAAHEVDSGYWREWDLFGLPGGAGLFVLLHVGIFFLLLWGYGQVVTGTRAGLLMSFVVGAGSLFAGAVHATFLLLGRPEFRTPVSIAVLAALAASGIVLLVASASASRRARTSPTG